MSPVAPSPVAEKERVVLPVRGMTCASCVRSVEQGLAKTPGVLRAEVSLVAETAAVEFDREKAGLPDLAEAVKNSGYEVPARRGDLFYVTRRVKRSNTKT